MNDFTSFEKHLAHVLANPLEVLHDARRTGRVVGYLGDSVPVELILAADALPIRLRTAAISTPRADEILESSFSPEARGVAELYLRGELNDLDAIVLPRNDDSAQRLYYYLCELQRRGGGGPKLMLFDVANIARDTSIEHTLQSLRQLADELGTQEDRLLDAIERVRSREQLLASVQCERSAQTALLGSWAYRVVIATTLDWRVQFDEQLRAALDGAPRTVSQRRFIFAGNSPLHTDFHTAVEDAGGVIVSETVVHVPTHASSADPWQGLALRYHRSASVAQQCAGSADYLVQSVRANDASGAILWLIEEDEALPWEVARQVRALAAANIPALVLTRQGWRNTTVARDAMREFVARGASQ